MVAALLFTLIPYFRNIWAVRAAGMRGGQNQLKFPFEHRVKSAGSLRLFRVFSALACLMVPVIILFNLLCVPCFAAVGAIRREMNSAGWTAFALLYQTALAYCVSLILYQGGLLLQGNGFSVFSIATILVFIGMLYLLFRPRPVPKKALSPSGAAA